MFSDNYDINATLHVSSDVEVLRCSRKSDRLPVVVKRAAKHATGDVMRRLQREFATLTRLRDARVLGVPTPLEISEGERFIAMTDSGGDSLRKHAERGRFPLLTVLELGIDIVNILSSIHRARVCHKDLTLGNVVYNADSKVVEVVDFDLATTLSHEMVVDTSIKAIEGTLGYISPEQTGRVNRSLDYRSDFYSLGVCLYEMLTGRMPFDNADIGEMMHAILVAPPVKISALVPSVPEVVCRIVAKLMEKSAEDRYQSAHGLVTDLQRCVLSLRAGNVVEDFTVGTADRSERFMIPEKLYGREAEIEQLAGAFRGMKVGERCTVFLRGVSGVGKSVLVRELHGIVVADGGLLISGKVDQLRRHVPFSTIANAIAELVRHIMLSDERTINEWRDALQEAVGTVGQALIEIAPAAQLVLGEQRPLSRLQPAENEERLQAVLQRFLRRVCAEQPLVLFLDDLQWADAATIKALRALSNPEAGVSGLLLIGAYRENEVEQNATFKQMLQQLDESGANVLFIDVKPLSERDITAMIEDSTHVHDGTGHELAGQVLAKTAGNAFFVREFLKHLAERDILFFDQAKNQWRWSSEAVNSSRVTGNVVDLLAEKLRGLPPELRATITLCACVGIEFKAGDVASARDAQIEATDRQLHGLAEEGFLLLLGKEGAEHRYRFVHDRVQQAAYELIGPDEVGKLHLSIARTIVARNAEASMASWVFQVVEHLLAARRVLAGTEDQALLATVCFTAAEESKRASAYAIARTYYDAYLSAQGADAAWSNDYARAWAAKVGLAECEFLLGMTEAAQEHLTNALHFSKTDIEKAEVQRRRATGMTALGRWDDAMDAGIAGLALLGHKLPRKPTTASVLLKFGGTMLLLRGKDPAALLGAPPLSDERELKKLELLSSYVFAAFTGNVNLFALTTLSMAQITIRHGNSIYSAYAYGALAVPLVQEMNDYKAARPFAQLALKLLAKRPDSFDPAFAQLVAHNFVEYVGIGPRQLALALREGYRLGIEAGDPIYGGLSALQEIVAAQRFSLEEGMRALSSYAAFFKSRGDPMQSSLWRSRQQTSLAFRGRTKSPLSLDSDDFAEATAVPAFPAASAREVFYGHKAWVLYTHGDLEGAYKATVECIDINAGNAVDEWSGHGLRFLGCIILTEHAIAHGQTKVSHPKWFNKFLRKFRAESAGDATAGFATLIEAQAAAMRGEHGRAFGLYETGCAQLEVGQHTYAKAAGYECAANYCLRRNLNTAAVGFCIRAVRAYEAWGATVKVAMLEHAWEGKLDAAPPVEPRRISSHSASSTRASTVGHSDIDLQVMMDASHALLGELSVDKLVAIIINLMLANAGADRAALIIQRGDAWIVKADTAHPEGREKPMRKAQLPERMINFVAASDRGVVIDDVSRPHDYQQDTYFGKNRPKSVLCTALKTQGKLIGVIYMENHALASAFSAERLQFVRLLATQAAVSLDKAHIYAHLEETVAERTQQLTQATDKLIRLERNTTESQMAGGFAHEMRNALAGVNLLLQDITMEGQNVFRDNEKALEMIFDMVDSTLAGDAKKSFRARVGEIAENLERTEKATVVALQALERGKKICDDILSYAQIGHVKRRYEPLAVSSVVTKVKEEMTPLLEQTGMRLDVDLADDLQVAMSEDHLYVVLRNLVANARDAVAARGVSDENRHVALQCAERNGDVRISVKDFGGGIPEHVRGRLFEPFFSTKGAFGTGLGLSTSRKLVEMYGGSLTLENAENYSTLFLIRLPNAGVSKKARE